jgi:hypothetical protein
MFCLLRLGTHMPKKLLISCKLCFQLQNFEIHLQAVFQQLTILPLDLFTALDFLPEAGC